GGTATVVITLNGTGAINGLALDSGGNPTPGTVVLVGTGNIPYNYTVQAGPDGTFSLPVVPAGSFNAVLSVRLTGLTLVGSAMGAVQPNKTANLTVQLAPSGSVSGKIFHSDGVSPAAGAQVTLNPATGGTATVVADSTGTYTFPVVPQGTFSLSVTDPGTGDRGAATNQITSNGQTVNINIALNGVGQVVVLVNNASGVAVPGASVTLSGQGQFGGSYSGTTASDGTFTFPNVLAGSFSLTATDPITGVSGGAFGSVASGATTHVTVQLQAIGSIAGHVYSTDGVTPVAGSTVTRTKWFNGATRQATSAVDGAFLFTTVQVGSYVLTSTDSNGALRARTPTFFLSTSGSTVTQNLVWVGVGTVTGRVF